MKVTRKVRVKKSRRKKGRLTPADFYKDPTNGYWYRIESEMDHTFIGAFERLPVGIKKAIGSDHQNGVELWKTKQLHKGPKGK